MTKVYVFYLRGDNSPYAFTLDKGYRDIFLAQRNRNLFFVKKMEMDKYELMVFMNKFKHKQLIQDNLYDGKTDIEIICTVEESDKLSESCEYISNSVDTLKTNLYKMPFKKKYFDIIHTILKNMTSVKNGKPTLEINTVSVFYKICKNTFIEDPEENNFKETIKK
jgi:hypothetical protein